MSAKQILNALTDAAPSSRSDEAWRRWGERDPYFAVLTHEGYRSQKLTDDAKRRFFQTGQEHTQALLGTVRRVFEPEFAPTRTLDFGCGTGRVTASLCEVSAEVVGVDVAPGMLREAERNCAEHGHTNVKFALADDRLSQLEGTFDLIHSFIVFQHIAPVRGLRLTRRLLSHLRPGGVVALHYTYAHPFTGLRALSARVQSMQPRLHSMLRRVLRPNRDPEMNMHTYPLEEVFDLLSQHGLRDIHCLNTDHDGYRGAFVLAT